MRKLYWVVPLLLVACSGRSGLDANASGKPLHPVVQHDSSIYYLQDDYGLCYSAKKNQSSHGASTVSIASVDCQALQRTTLLSSKNAANGDLAPDASGKPISPAVQHDSSIYYLQDDYGLCVAAKDNQSSYGSVVTTIAEVDCEALQRVTLLDSRQ